MINLMYLMKCSTNHAAFYFKLFMCNYLEVLQGSDVLGLDVQPLPGCAQQRWCWPSADDDKAPQQMDVAYVFSR
jgi:hypothetical protein